MRKPTQLHRLPERQVRLSCGETRRGKPGQSVPDVPKWLVSAQLTSVCVGQIINKIFALSHISFSLTFSFLLLHLRYTSAAGTTTCIECPIGWVNRKQTSYSDPRQDNVPANHAGDITCSPCNSESQKYSDQAGTSALILSTALFFVRLTI